ncbi:MAG: amino acid adenylation domain-containing protein [Crocinitomix sp.]|jgi:amino acid adenylation domain-containing protein/non-ribosomal peptide synthase protein (TIGR01720 family)
MKELIAELRARNIYLSIDQDELVVDFDGDSLPAELISKIKESKAAIINYLSKYSNHADYSEIPQVSHSESYRASSGQSRLWLLSQFEGNASAYNLPAAIVLDENIDIECFKKAIAATIDRHEILRTVFKKADDEQDGEVRQWILTKEELGFEIDYKDFSGEEKRQTKVQSYIADDSTKSFDLEKGPLLRASLIKTEEASYVFYYNLHHIISDGWSTTVLFNEVLSFYKAFVAGNTPQLEELRIQYKDYSAWQKNQFQQDAFKLHSAYWKEKLSGELPLLDLPCDRQRPRTKTNNGHELSTYFGGELIKNLKTFTEENGGSLFMTLLASWNVLLYRYTGQKDIITGTAVAGRDHVDLENQIGFYVNTLALRNQINPEENFKDYYQNLKNNTLESYSHQMYPFDELVEELNVHRDTSRNPICDVMFILQNNTGIDTSADASLEKDAKSEKTETELNQIKDCGFSTSKFDLDLSFYEEGDQLQLRLVYNPDVYDFALVEGLIRHYKQLTNLLVERSSEKMAGINYLSQAEEQELLVNFNDTTIDFFKDNQFNSLENGSIANLFDKQALITPNSIAFEFNGQQLTYQSLAEQSNQFAHYLVQSFNIQPSDIIGVKLSRNLDYPIVLMGILKAAACCSPINPDLPIERLEKILPNCKLLIDQTQFEHFQLEKETYPVSNLEIARGSENLAYIMYTSGSTGDQKACMLENRGIVNHLFSKIADLELDAETTILHTSKMYFVGGIWQLWAPLLVGGKVVIPTINEIQDISVLLEMSAQNNVKVFEVVPSQIANLFAINKTQQLDGIERLILTGEPLKKDLLDKILALNKDIQITNTYGQTECSDVTTTYKISSQKEWDHKLVGRPIQNTTHYILDAHQSLCPIGVDGEIYTGGLGVSRGYLNREKLTNETFIASPFKEGERLYKTGDLARWTKNGELRFVGRKDHQVKVRGFRIELGEIEHALIARNGIKEVVIIAKENQTSNENELVAYLTANETQNVNDLRAFLKESLPDYMLPAYFVQLDELPLTTNGKINKKALPDPEGLGLISGVEYVAPESELEKKLVEIWETVLERENVGIKDDFFALGGHSLKAVRLSNAYQKELGVKVALKDLFALGNISAQSEFIQSLAKEDFVHIPVLSCQIGEGFPISDGQRRMWVLSQFEEASVAYNMPGTIYLQEEIKIDLFKKAINSAIARHEILRTVFKADDSGKIRQWILDPSDSNFALDYKDYSEADDANQMAQSYIAKDSYQPFDLEKGPLLRAALLKVDENTYVFYFNVHHIISDDWSMEVLSKDVFAYYKANKENSEPTLSPLEIQYKDYASWQLNQLKDETFEDQRAFWLDSLASDLGLLNLPSAIRRPRIKRYNGQMLRTYLDADLTDKLKKYSQENGGSLFMGVLAAWNVLMYQYTSQKDVIIGTPIAGRDHTSLEDQIGFYVNTLALRNEVNPQENFNDFYKRIKNKTLKSYDSQMYPFDRLVEELGLKRDTSRSAVFDISITYHNVAEASEVTVLDQQTVNQIVSTGATKVRYDIELHFQEYGDNISFNLIYDEDIYEREMTEGLMTNFKQILNALLVQSDENISNIDYINQEEKHKLLVDFNDLAVDFPATVVQNLSKGKTIVELFEDQVKKTPNNIAVVFEETELTYTELDKLTNQLAHCLKEEHAVVIGELIGIELERSDWNVISILGVLKSGAAYVPIDPAYPEARKKHIINDTALKLLITRSDIAFEIDYFEGSIFCIDVELDEAADDLGALNLNHKLDDLAYVIYTSGSTGKPKGVMIEHEGLVNSCVWHQTYFEVVEEDRATLFAGVAFDASVAEMFPYLISGSSLYIVPPQLRTDISDLNSFFEINKISISFLPTQIAEKFLAVENNSLRILLTGGEKLNNFKKKKYKVVNNYGPTENTVVATSYHVQTNDLNIPIGIPISNVQVYLLNEEGAIQPIGVTGEICIGGTSLARGYLNQEELTREKFIDNPFKEGERLYKTGDLGKWLPDGNIKFLGRKDDQVKIRGYRIELGEIEKTLSKNKLITETVVLAKYVNNTELEGDQENTGGKELVAYFTATEAMNASELRSYLKESLPEYMLPAHFIQLEKMPITANGKVDKKNLPDPEGIGVSTGVEYVAANTEQERILVSIWEEVLKRESISVKDSFYNLGGDSIKSIQVITRVKQLGFALKVEDILGTPVLGELALLMKEATQYVDQGEVNGFVELTPIQHWFFESGEIKDLNHYNQAVLLKSAKIIDRGALDKTLAALVSQHDALRMIYRRNEGVWEQINQDDTDKKYALYFHDLSEVADPTEQMSLIGQELQSNISIEEGPLFRVVQFRLKDGDRIGLICHHLIIDGVSWRILLEDLSSLYAGFNKGIVQGLPLKTDSFKKWALAQKEYASSEKLENERSYWKEISKQEIKSLKRIDASSTTDNSDEQENIVSMESFRLNAETTELLQTKVHDVYRTEINDLLLTALGIAIKEAFSINKTVLKMEGHGREDILDSVDISRTIGWFSTVYPFILQIAESKDYTESLIGVKEALRKVPNKGIGYGILKHLSEEGIDGEIIPEIIFNYLGDFGSNASNDENSVFEYAAESIGRNMSKENRDHSLLDISGILINNELNISVAYSKSIYDADSIKNLTEAYQKNLQLLIEELSNQTETVLTPSDLTFKGLQRDELAQINLDNSVEDIYELSPLQEGIYYHWLTEGAGSQYFEQMSYRIRAKELDIDKLKGAYDSLVARHGVLRTSFTNGYAGKSLQIVRKEASSNFYYENIGNLNDASDKKNYVEQIKQKDKERGFDLTSESQMRLQVLELAEDEFEFIWSHHHILMDGWCMGVLINDFNQFWSNETIGTELNLNPAIPYSNYIDWLKTINRESSLTHWKNYLAGYSEVTEVPFNLKAEGNKYVGSREYLHVEGDLFKKVDGLCNQLGITHSTFMQGVWGYLLSRYNNTNDVVFGTVVSGRPPELNGVEDMIGLFINTIPVRVKYESDETTNELLKRLQEEAIQTNPHHYINLSEVQAQSELGKDMINHIMVFENYVVKEMDGEGVLNTEGNEEFSIESKEIFERTNYDLNLTVVPSENALSLTIIYNENCYTSSSLKRLMNHFVNVVGAFATDEDQSLNAIDYLTTEEKQELLIGFNDNQVGYPTHKTVVDLFEEQVAETPNKVALVFNEKELTYQELNEKSNQLAHYLVENYNLQANDLVGIKQDRTEWMLISILGILKAGGAYVPIDSENPKDRIDYIENDTNCKVCIDEKELKNFKNKQGNYSSKDLKNQIEPNNTAYVIYTSGSTGKPKGVLVDHHNVVRLFKPDNPIFNFDSEDVWTMFHSYAFDFSVWEMYGALLFGGKLVVIPKIIAQDPKAYLALLEKEEVTVLNQTPSAFYNLSKAEKEAERQLKVRYVIFGGEALSPGKLQHWHERYPNCELINMYGITETTVHTTFKEITWEDIALNKSNIGKAIPTVTCIILDQNKNLVPFGIAGEMYIGGEGVAKGYLNQEVLTTQRFIANPFVAGDKLYRTGDKIRQLKGGDLEYLGRIDNQVKIRGHRIELEEIEHTLLKNKNLEGAVAIAKSFESDKDDEKNEVTAEMEIIAYVTSKQEQNASDLRDFLKESLPDYMLPAYYVQLDELPLTSNGKVDKKALPDPSGLGLKSGVEYVAPRDEVEEKLVLIWEQVLQIENIGIQDDFFNLGGHSLKAVRLSNVYQKELNVKLALKDLFANPSIAAHAEFIKAANATTFIQIDAVKKEESYPISDGQRRLWVLSQFEEASIAYNMPGQIWLNQAIEFDHFEKAVNSTIARHEILRTVFNETESGDVRQRIIEKDNFNFKIDYKDFSREEDSQSAVRNYTQNDAEKPFDLAKGPLLRAALIRVAEQEYVFYYNMHHIITDGWSLEILATDVFAYYEAYVNNSVVELTDLRIQYKDYASWQLAQLKENASVEHRAFWLDSLSEELPVLDLPNAKQRPKLKTNKGHGLKTYLNSKATSGLKQYSTENGGTLFMGLLAVWNVLIHRYTSQTDIVIGTPVAGREHKDLENQIGFYINTLALRNEIDPTENFNDFYKRLKENTLKSYDHQMYPFDRLVEELKLQRDTSRSAVFDVMLILQNNADTATIQAESAIITENSDQIIDLGQTVSKFDIELTFQEVGDHIVLNAVFNPDLYDKEMIESLVAHYKQLLNGLIENPEKSITKIDYLSNQEKQNLLVAFNNTDISTLKAVEQNAQKYNTVLDLFAEQVIKTPNSIAVVYEDQSLTYQELDEKSNQLAHYLKQNYSITANDLVGIKHATNQWAMVSILAVLKSGGAYVPIDLEYPQERIDYVENDAQCKVCIDEAELEKFNRTATNYAKTVLNSKIDKNDLVYVIYTSGSTGKPKGVIVEHINLLHSTNARINVYEPGQTFLLLSSISFDSSIVGIFGTLLFGGCLVLTPTADAANLDKIAEIIEREKVSQLLTVPTFYKLLLTKLETKKNTLKIVTVAGEECPKSLVEAHHNAEYLQNCDLFNEYGPTEGTVWSSYYKYAKSDAFIDTIGKPIATAQIYLLNEENQLQPIGVAGEMCIGGLGVTKGYLNQSVLTEEKFVANPFVAGERMYKTGDLACWLPDGNITFLGRKDDQVKVRGYRVELGEIEYALTQHPAINQAVVLVKENKENEKELVAYLASDSSQNNTSEKENEALNISGLRTFLSQYLPAFMLPTHYIQLDEIPLTSNGKINKKAFPSPEGLGLASGVEYVKPMNAVEEQLTQIWEDVLDKEQIGMHDDFFMLGGHSLKAIALNNKYKQHFEVKLTVKDLFNHTSVIAHARLIANADKEQFNAIKQVRQQKNYPVSDAQRRLWILSQYEAGSVAYNMVGRLYLEQDLQIDTFKRAITATIDRHEILRTVFKEDPTIATNGSANNTENSVDSLRQWVINDLDFKLDLFDFSNDPMSEEKVEAYISKDTYSPFDLENGPLLRAALLKINPETYVFHFNLHHIISDGWSMQVLAKDVFAFYEAFKLNQQPDLKELPVQYKDYSAWQLADLSGDLGAGNKNYWIEKLAGKLPVMDLPFMQTRPDFRTYKGAIWSTYINPELTKKLRDTCIENGGTIFHGILTSWLILMHKYTSDEELIIGTSVAGRNHPDLENQIGFYTNSVSLRNQVSAENDFLTQLKQVIENTNEVMEHQNYPFNKVVEDIQLKRDSNRNPVFDSMLVFNNANDKTNIENLDYEAFKFQETNAKLDLEITVTDSESILSFGVIYDAEIFESKRIKKMISEYKFLLNELLSKKDTEIKQIKIADNAKAKMKKMNLSKLTSKR